MATHMRRAIRRQLRGGIHRGMQISHLERMPRLRRARSGRGQNLQKSTLRWRPTVGQTAASFHLASSSSPYQTLLPLQLRVFRAAKSGNRNVHGFPAIYSAHRDLPNGINGYTGFKEAPQTRQAVSRSNLGACFAARKQVIGCSKFDNARVHRRQIDNRDGVRVCAEERTGI
jgi:hypothetical protein